MNICIFIWDISLGIELQFEMFHSKLVNWINRSDSTRIHSFWPSRTMFGPIERRFLVLQNLSKTNTLNTFNGDSTNGGHWILSCTNHFNDLCCIVKKQHHTMRTTHSVHVLDIYMHKILGKCHVCVDQKSLTLQWSHAVSVAHVEIFNCCIDLRLHMKSLWPINSIDLNEHTFDWMHSIFPLELINLLESKGCRTHMHGFELHLFESISWSLNGMKLFNLSVNRQIPLTNCYVQFVDWLERVCGDFFHKRNQFKRCLYRI